MTVLNILSRNNIFKLNKYNLILNSVYKNNFSTGIVNKFNTFNNKSFLKNFKLFSEFTKSIDSNASNKNVDKIVGIWLAGCSFMVAGAIIIGGYTRLKNAGLSMVKWQAIKDLYLPNSNDEWIELYEEYKLFPEYNLSNDEITLEKFKKIFFLEYFHRIWGRLTGAIFIVPSIILFFMGKLKGMEKRVIIYNILVLLQGLVGWYMVKSGLKEETMSSYGDPGVSQYRLATHLGFAFILYSLTTWQSMKLLLKKMKVGPGYNSIISKGTYMSSHIALLMIFITSLYGGIVAGMDAGKVCDTYPKMNGKWIPDGINDKDLGIKNIFENPITAQFIHRLLAHITALSCFYTVYKTYQIEMLPRRMNKAIALTIGFTLFQMYLGIKTVESGVDIETALNHQLGAICLLTSVLFLSLELGRLKKGQFIKSNLI